ncbi:MAG TPA: dodecin [Rhodospirillales bacterium]|nr:dodecin [Rhodospirillales bacterium]
MPNSVYKKAEFVGTSPNSISEAINNAIAHASATDKITWFEVVEMRGHVEDSKVSQYQVVLKVGFRVGP